MKTASIIQLRVMTTTQQQCASNHFVHVTDLPFHFWLYQPQGALLITGCYDPSTTRCPFW